MTYLGGNGFDFIDQAAKSAQSVDQLEWIVAHNVCHELMLAFGVPEVHDKTGNFLDAEMANVELLNPRGPQPGRGPGPALEGFAGNQGAEQPQLGLHPVRPGGRPAAGPGAHDPGPLVADDDGSGPLAAEPVAGMSA